MLTKDFYIAYSDTNPWLGFEGAMARIVSVVNFDAGYSVLNESPQEADAVVEGFGATGPFKHIKLTITME